MNRLRLLRGIALAGLLAGGCAGVNNKASSSTGGSSGNAGTSGAAGHQAATGGSGALGTGGSPVVTGAGGSSPDAGCTSTVTCTPPGGEYCGTIGNGCPGGSITCGACPGDGVCTNGLCLGGPSCVKLTCSVGSAQYCGTVGDGCGGSLSCGACPSGQTCSGGICVIAGCVPATCNAGGGNLYCGTIGDGCGGTDDCGTCANGMACATSGALAHVCPATGTTCSNLQCNLDKCSGGGETSISGTVYDPAGLNPLYNVLLYVPNTAVDPIPQGVSCNTCNSPISGTPVAAGLSDATGHFVIHNAPHGTNVPLVIQIGKWRRQVTLPTVTACQDNPVNDPQTYRLPKKQSEGDLPQIAISTGHADALDCFLRRVGVDDSEFTADTGTGRVHMYVGGAGVAGDEGSATLASGAALSPAYTKLFPSFSQMSKYDIVVLTCESEQLASDKDPDVLNMKRYADSGGKVFAEHLHSY